MCLTLHKLDYFHSEGYGLSQEAFDMLYTQLIIPKGCHTLRMVVD
jgi:hypothetical protein